jgi:hypothetical protein
LTGRPWSGALLVLLWMVAWTVGAPAVIDPILRVVGAGAGLSGLRSGSVPAPGGVEAAVILAVPLGIAVWLAANAGVRRLRGA